MPGGCQRFGDLLDPFRRWKFTVVYEADFHRARQSARTCYRSSQEKIHKTSGVKSRLT